MSEVQAPPTPVPDGYRLRLEVVIPPGAARAISVRRGEVLQVIDVRGSQVADLMAWLPERPGEFLSPSHTISCLKHLVPAEGESFYSNHRRELLRIRRDTVGRHDLIVPCCDPERYQVDYGLTDHRSCLSSIQEALAAAGVDWEARGELAANIFMNNTVEADGSIVTHEPPHVAGDHIELEVLENLGVAVSSCPQDLTPCNGWKITEIALRVFEPAG